MRAADIMVRNVVTVRPDSDVADAIKLLVEHDISALPVVDTDGKLVGILSEADLMRRVEIGTQARPGWIESLIGASSVAQEFAKSHGKRVAEIMTEDVITATEDTSLADIAGLLERHRIKRVPVTRDDGHLVGIVSRSNMMQVLATTLGHEPEHQETDGKLREELLESLAKEEWTDFGDRNITVHSGTVHLWGLVGSEDEHKALLALVESIPGVRSIADETIPAY